MDNSSSSASASPQERQRMFEGTEGDEPPLPRSEEEEEQQEKEKKKYEQPQEGDDDAVPHDEDDDTVEDDHEGAGRRERYNASSPSNTSIAMRCLFAGVFFYAAVLQLSTSSSFYTTLPSAANGAADGGAEGTYHPHDEEYSAPRRRLTAVMGDTIPSYMTTLMRDLKERQQLFQDTPPEEIKYWFEYTGPLQKYFYRYSKSRGKADYFEGRDDSGVTSSRFTEDFLGSKEHNHMFSSSSSSSSQSKSGSNHHTMKYRLLENCLAMGSPVRPDTTTPVWKEWYGGGSSKDEENGARHVTYGYDRCRVLLTLNTVGAGRGTTMLWETAPPSLPHAQQPTNWQSEQETAATHLQRQFEEINAMCATNQIAARVQVLVCEPIAAKWTEWMDSLLPHCGGRVSNLDSIDMKTHQVEERASPIQVVVVATVESAETCHDLQSGFMERRTQDLIVAPPFVGDSGSAGVDTANPAMKRTHPDLLSSADHDVYVGLKWTSLVTVRALHSFLQASADLAAGATSPINNQKDSGTDDENDLTVSTAPSSPFLIPSFVRVSYVSEENTKVAKWRMHGDFFHPAAWEICKDSFEVTWLDHSLSGPGGVTGLCYDPSTQATMKRRLAKSQGSSSSSSIASSNTHECGQWWIYNTELQMPNRPDVYANEITPPLVQGGNNFVWMLTERQRREIVKRQMCLHDIELEEEEAEDEADTQKKKKKKDEDPAATKKASAAGRRKLFEQKKKACPAPPQAVMPLGDVESFLINYTPNTALGKKHVKDRRPGYSRAEERAAERELVKERKQLKGQEDIEKALFDYTIYPAALLRKDATLKAARGRDAVLVASAAAAAAKAKAKAKAKTGGDNTHEEEEEKHSIGPSLIKSDYYDVTVTKPRQPVPGWCQAIARKGLCILYSDYFRTSNDVRCLEACGMKKNFSPIATETETDDENDTDHDTDGVASSSNKKKKEKK